MAKDGCLWAHPTGNRAPPGCAPLEIRRLACAASGLVGGPSARRTETGLSAWNHLISSSCLCGRCTRHPVEARFLPRRRRRKAPSGHPRDAAGEQRGDRPGPARPRLRRAGTHTAVARGASGLICPPDGGNSDGVVSRCLPWRRRTGRLASPPNPEPVEGLVPVATLRPTDSPVADRRHSSSDIFPLLEFPWKLGPGIWSLYSRTARRTGTIQRKIGSGDIARTQAQEFREKCWTTTVCHTLYAAY